MRTLTVTAVLAATLLTTGAAADWDYSRATIPTDEIRGGGPPKDGIPALVLPKTVSSGEATFLQDEDSVLGLVVGGDARAYPLRILSWHELVNDRVGGEPVLVSW